MSSHLHRVQMSILGMLRHAEDARFSALMQPTGLQSDTFKFHLRKLVNSGYVEKSEAGSYQLTSVGKEFANNLDENRLAVQRQPKVSILLIVPKPGKYDEQLYLFQKRCRNPFFDFWSCIGGPVQWGEDAEETAVKELKKQTGLTAECTVRAFYRKRDYETESQDLLEDKLFVVLEATGVKGALFNTWHGGHNEWMTVNEFKKQSKYFGSVCEAIEMVARDKTYMSKDATYMREEY